MWTSTWWVSPQLWPQTSCISSARGHTRRRRPHQRGEQLELGRRQADLLARAPHPVGVDVDEQVAVAQHLVVVGGAATGADAAGATSYAGVRAPRRSAAAGGTSR